MKRFIINKLIKWKESSDRKPLIIQGARQIGKTWILQELGKTFKNGYVKIDFDKQPQAVAIFENTKDPIKIIEKLEIICNKKITTDVLIIFDEIQECPNALNALKYFNESAKQYFIVCAGSLLGVSLSEKGFPVGQVHFMDMYPMSFSEFLLAIGKESLFNHINNLKDLESLDFIKDDLIDAYKQYLVIGGMPEVIKKWVDTKDFEQVKKVQENLILAYESDFHKHTGKTESMRINYVWNSIPSQLAKENKKFLYSAVITGARAREYESAIRWLTSSRLVNTVYRINNISIPLSSFIELTAFKLYMNDTGLLCSVAKLPMLNVLIDAPMFNTFKGSLAENFVLQSLIRQYPKNIYYWSDEVNEVDFIIQKQQYIIPIEVKSSTNVKSSSLKSYLKKYDSKTPLAVRVSLKDLKFDGKILNVPLYLIDQLDQIIDIGLRQQTK